MTYRLLQVSFVALLIVALFPLRVAAIAALTSSQNPADEAALRTLIERYFEAYGSKDLDAVVRLWSDKSPDLGKEKVRLKEFFSRNNEIAAKNPRSDQFEVEGDHASAVVTVDGGAIDAKTGQPRADLGAASRAMSFVKEAGEWKVWRDVSPEEELAARLVAAKSEEDRKAIFSEHRELIGPALRKSVIELAEALRIKAKYSDALTVLEMARQVAEQTNDQTGIAEVTNFVGNVQLAQNKFEIAMESYQKGLQICTTLADRACVATALVGIGNSYLGKRQYDLAVDFTKRSLTLSEELGYQPGIFDALISMGNIYRAEANYSKALETYQKALPISESARNTPWLALVKRNIGVVQRQRGEFAEAIESYQKSAELYEQLGDMTGVANVHNGIGIIHSQRGDYGSAMRFFQKCLETFEQLQDKKGIADSTGNIGIVQRLQGNYSLALEYQKKYLALSEAIGEQQGIANSLNNMGIVYVNQANYIDALKVYEESLKLNEALGSQGEMAAVFSNMGVAYRDQGNYDLALETLRKGLQIREKLGQRNLIAGIFWSMAIAYNLKGNPQDAAIYSERAASLAREIGLRAVLSGALTTAGQAYMALGEREKSRAAFEEAIESAEAMRGQLAGGEQDQQRYFELVVSPYYQMVELLTVQGNAAEALSYAERGKARLLLDVLKTGRINIQKAMTIAERAREREIRDSFVLLNTQISSETRRPQPDQKRLSELKAQLETARLSQQDFQTKLYAAHPELQIQRGEVPRFQLQDAAALVADSSTALLEYAVTDGKTYLFVLTRSTTGEAEVKGYTIPIKRKELATQVEALREKLASHNLLVREPARQAYDLLLKPAQPLLRGKTRLIIVPDDSLWELPFQALLTESNRYLIEESAISYAPSLTVLREMIAKRKERSVAGLISNSLLAMGNPSLGKETIERARATRRDEKLDPLPEAEREVETLARLYGPSRSQVLVGAEAREDRAKSEAGKFKVLHFATHGVVNNSSPMYSHLVLSQGDGKEDGLLEAWELLNLDLKADMVVLSACETARGRVGAGEGMIGLSWSLFVAGAPTAVVSQWKVDSTSTTELMLEFHRNRLATNSKAQSLRTAMLKMLSSNKYKHPFYWAPFVMIGDAN